MQGNPTIGPPPPQIVPSIRQFPDLPSAEQAKRAPALMLQGDCNLPSNPIPFLLSVGASLHATNRHLVSEPKDAIAKAHEICFNSFLGESTVNNLENMLHPPQPWPSFESGTLICSF